MKSWNDLKWWESKECAALHEKLGWNQKWSHFPEQKHVYRALHETAFADVKCVIVGQDPYPSRGMANGLAFSVDASVEKAQYPQTLRNIFKELFDDLQLRAGTGDLVAWARRGVLLWNTCLTVKPGNPGSHQGWGWETLTREVLSSVDEHHRNVVFVLWGRQAQKHLSTVLPSVSDKRNHVVLSAHPSPLSAHAGFFGSRPFSTVNSLLKGQAIDWSL